MRILSGLVAIFALVTAAAPATAQTMAVGTTGIGANVVVSTAIAQVLSAHTDRNVITQSYGGEAQIIPVVNVGRLDLGVSNVMEMVNGFNGVGTFEGRAQTNLRLIGTLMPIRAGLIVRDESELKSIGDLKGRTLASGFNAQPLARMLHEGYLANGGLIYDDVQRVPSSTIADHWTLFEDGTIEAASMGYGSGKARELEATIGKLRYLQMDPSPEAVARLNAKVPGGYVVKFEADPNIPGLDQPTHILAYDYTIWTYADMPDEVVYEMVKAIYENSGELSESGPQWRGFDPDTMAKDHGIPFHPGAQQFYQERNLLK